MSDDGSNMGSAASIAESEPVDALTGGEVMEVLHSAALDAEDANNVWRFGHAVNCSAEAVHLREFFIVRAIDSLTDKEDWHEKVFDDAIVQKWRAEAVNTTAGNGLGFSDEMFDFLIEELKDKATIFEQSGLVRVLDTRAAVIKADSAVPAELDAALSDIAYRLLEDVPERAKDWHPGSDDQVLDLIHPSLFPLVYGLSLQLTEGTMDLDNCLAHMGKGQVAIAPSDRETGYDSSVGFGSEKFQWLPTDFKFTPSGVKAVSYINNLHPVHQRELYPVIEKLIDCAVPLWSEALSYTWEDRHVAELRFADKDPEYDYDESTHIDLVRKKFIAAARSDTTGKTVEPTEIASDDEGHDDGWETPYSWDSDHEVDWPQRRRTLLNPEPRPYAAYKEILQRDIHFHDLREEFASQGLQVIVKLANIHLNPSKPSYKGGSWHVEGLLNERICATALYYYDNTNVTSSHLAFRQGVDTEEMTMRPGQSDYAGHEHIFGIDQEGPGVQHIGQVHTRQGRMIAFPNIIQHQVQPFELADKTQPGHRKIVALFLIDPSRPVASTTTVPPQRLDWWAEQVRATGALDKVPEEVRVSILDGVEGFPISWDKALELRLELMDERRGAVEQAEEYLMENAFNFCEH